MQKAIQAARSGDWSEVSGVVTAGGIALEPSEYELVLETTGRPEGEALAIVPTGGFVLLDTRTTPELEAEGLARDVIRAVQETRKNADFDVSDRIQLVLRFQDDVDTQAVVSAFDLAGIAAETLAEEYYVIDAQGDSIFGHGAVLAAAAGVTPEFSAVIPAGTYANAGDFTIAVTRMGAGA